RDGIALHRRGWLPLSHEHGWLEAPVSEAVDRPAARGRRIVLVDDQPDALESMCALLRIWGHEVQAVSNGEDAIALVLSHRPDVVILDLKMPGMSGHEVARRIRRVLDPHSPLLVALTA